jgi:hypothetical protein
MEEILNIVTAIPSYALRAEIELARNQDAATVPREIFRRILVDRAKVFYRLEVGSGANGDVAELARSGRDDDDRLAPFQSKTL